LGQHPTREGHLTKEKFNMKNSFDNSLNACKITNTDAGVHLVANAKTDFICKYKEYIKDEASFFYIEKTGDFTIKAEVETKGNFAYDAAFLMVRETKTRWIKLAVELGVDTKYNVVSVITDNWSDDANGELIPSNKCWLRITRKNDFWGLHYSLNGDKWRFVRCFGLDLPSTVKVGFGIQAPLGDKCEGKLDFITLSEDSVKNFRDGS
jgi:regulation of enolase protein 1 (concanavalin A-like superfamily)